MITKKKIYVIICCCLITVSDLPGNGIRESSENFIIESCGSDTNFDFKKFMISAELRQIIEKECEQKFYRDEVIYWEIYKGSELKYIAVIDNVYGKTLPITFLVIFNLDGSIYRNTVIKYREEHGGEVSGKNWLAQFNGRNRDSSFNVGSDIQSISGATISVNSVSRGIKKLTILFTEIYKLNEYTAK